MTAENIVLTDNAINKINSLQSDNIGKFLRLKILGGGCSGFQYDFSLCDNCDDVKDYIISENDKILFVIDKISLDFVKGSTIDFKDDLAGSEFILTNPNASSNCGCGSSFSI